MASSGGFVTILFGLLAIAAGTDDLALDTVPRVLVITALMMLFTAVIAGIGAGFPRKYAVPEAEILKGLTADDIWRGSGVKTAQRIAEAKLTVLKTSRASNRFKSRALIIGFAAEVVAVVLVAAAVLIVL